MKSSQRIEISIDDQTLKLIEGDQCVREFNISTALKGMGFVKDTYRTPTGRFRIHEKIGDGEMPGTIFKMRVPVGQWSDGDERERDLILTRVIRLEGLDPQNANTLERNIYIHGTNRADRIGQPASMGCIRMGNEDMIELFNRVKVGTELEIHRATQQRGKLLFIDCDSTLSTIEGIDELARAKGDEVFAQVVARSRPPWKTKVWPGLAARLAFSMRVSPAVCTKPPFSERELPAATRIRPVLVMGAKSLLPEPLSFG